METSKVEQSGVRVGEQGRIVIPARVREKLGIVAGDELVARVEGGRLLLEKRENVLRRLRERFSAVPGGVSLADELILERREEARREESR
jgi:AbrB family looped-hinge helix DNA binding protein